MAIKKETHRNTICSVKEKLKGRERERERQEIQTNIHYEIVCLQAYTLRHAEKYIHCLAYIHVVLHGHETHPTLTQRSLAHSLIDIMNTPSRLFQEIARLFLAQHYWSPAYKLQVKMEGRKKKKVTLKLPGTTFTCGQDIKSGRCLVFKKDFD